MTTILDIICNILEKFLITASKGVLDIKYKKKTAQEQGVFRILKQFGVWEHLW